MNLVMNRPELYDAEAHENFFAGWPTKQSYKNVRTHLNHAQSIFAVQGEELIGLITAITDTALFAFIPLLEVRTDLQNQGVGTSLLKAMESHLGEIYGIDLVCDPDLVPFYEARNFLSLSAMVKRNPKAL